MSPDESTKRGQERRQLLEEIRKRAEEAELKRIEEEEEKLRPPKDPQGTPPETPTAKEDEISIEDLRADLDQALNAGDAGQASRLYSLLARQLSGEPILIELKARISALEIDGAKRLAGGIRSRTSGNDRQKQVAELLKKAKQLYEDEDYVHAAAMLDQLNAIDPGNRDAESFRISLQKAHRLAEQVRQEEVLHKAKKEEPAEQVLWPKESNPERKGSPPADHVQLSEFGTTRKPEQNTTTDLASTQISWRSFHSLKWLVAALLLGMGVAVGYVVIDKVRDFFLTSQPGVIVFPVVPTGFKEADRYYTEGATEIVIADLSTARGLQVFGLPTALSFQGTNEGRRGMARKLGTRYYVHLSASTTTNVVTLSASVFDTSLVSPLATGEYKDSTSNFATLCVRVTRRILQSLQVDPSTVRHESRGITRVPEALEAYMEGRYSLKQRMFVHAIKSLEVALDIDPSSSDVLVALGWAHILAFEGGDDTSHAHIERASVLVRRAIGLGSRTSETFRLWGIVEQYRLQMRNAVERFEQAVDVSPSDADSWRRLAIAYAASRRGGDARKAAQRGAELDPYNGESWLTLGLIDQYNKEYEKAFQSFERGLMFATDSVQYRNTYIPDLLVYLQRHEHAADLTKDHLETEEASYVDYYKLGRILQRAGKPKAEWGPVLEKARELISVELARFPENVRALSYLSLVETRFGNFDGAVASGNRALASSQHDPEVLYNVARMYALQKDKKPLALEYLEKALKQRYNLAMILEMDFSNLRSDPDFSNVVTF